MFHLNATIGQTIAVNCAVPEKNSIPPPPLEGHWKFLGGGGGLKAKMLEAKYDPKLKVPGGTGRAKQKTFCGGSINISWNCTLHVYIMTKSILNLKMLFLKISVSLLLYHEYVYQQITIT